MTQSTRLADLLNELEATARSELLVALARITELETEKKNLLLQDNRRIDENDRLLDNCTRLETLNTHAQETITSLTSQMEHWKREFERADMLAKAYERKAKRGGSCVADIQAAIDAYGRENNSFDTELGSCDAGIRQ